MSELRLTSGKVFRGDGELRDCSLPCLISGEMAARIDRLGL